MKTLTWAVDLKSGRAAPSTRLPAEMLSDILDDNRQRLDFVCARLQESGGRLVVNLKSQL